MAKVTQFTRPAVRIRIDLNARDVHGYVPARLSRANGLMAIGDTVVAFEPDDEVRAPAEVMKIVGDFAYLDVRWNELEDDVVAPVIRTIHQTDRTGQQTGSLSSMIRFKLAMPAIAGAAALAAIAGPGLVQTSPATPHAVEAKDVHLS